MNSTKHLLHPELQVMAETKIIGEINDENLIKVRKTLDDLKPELTDAESFGVTRKEIYISRDNGSDIRCLLYIPKNKEDNLGPGYLHIHGGGYILGSPDGSDIQNVFLDTLRLTP